MRLVERQSVIEDVIAPLTSEKSIDATTTTVDQGIDATPLTVDSCIQSTPTLVDRLIEAKPDLLSVFVEAAPAVVEQSVGTETEPEIQPEVKETMEPLEYENPRDDEQPSYFITWPSIISGIISSACKTFFLLPLYVPARVLDMSLAAYHARIGTTGVVDVEKPSRSNTESSTSSAELLDISPVCL